MNLGVFCIAKDCPLKEKCKRAMKGTIRKFEGNTSFIPAPFKTVDGKFECDMFLGNPDDYLRQQLKSVISNHYKNN